jgi:DNA sulfur modification protein DndD
MILLGVIKMKIEKIMMKNFRQFYDLHELEFSTDNKKNITIIHAENGVGKTTILNAVLWAMYGETTNRFEQKDSIINFTAVKEGAKGAFVEVYFEHEDEDYLVLRHYLNKNGKGSEELKAFKISEGDYEELPAPASFVNSVIPSDISKYFFFDGEHAETFASEHNNRDVNNAIRNILGCGMVETAIEDLQKISKDYQRDIGQIAGTTEREKLESSRRKLELDVDQAKKYVKELGKEIETKEHQEGQIQKKLRGSEGARKLQGVRDHKNRDLKDAVRQLADAQSEVSGWVSEHGLAVVSQKLASESLDFIEEGSSRGAIPSPYNEEFVTKILEDEICICDRPIKAGSKEFKAVRSLLEHAANASLRGKVSRARGRTTAIKEEAKSSPAALEAAIKRRESCAERVSLYERELAEISENIRKLPEDKSREQEEARLKLSGQIRQLYDKRSRTNVDIESNSRDLIHVQSEIDKIDSTDDLKSSLILRRDLAELCGQSLETDLEDYEKSARTAIIKMVNDILEKTSRRHYKAIISNDFSLRMKLEADGQIVPKSGGENQLLSLAFIASLVGFSGIRRKGDGTKWIAGTVAPLILDSPFGQLDPYYRTSTANFLPDLAEQVILLVSGSQGDEKVLKAIKDRVGKEYVLVSHNPGEQGPKPDDKITLKGKSYILSLYGQERQMTSIQTI